MRRTTVVVALALAVVALIGSPASAHNRLVSAVPADGSVLATAPAQIRLMFAQRPDPGLAQLAVTGPDGGRITLPALSVTGTTLVQPVTLTLAGRYQVGYRVVSADAHPITGTITFTVQTGAAPTSASPSAPAASSSNPGGTVFPDTRADGGTNRWAGFALLGGGLLVLTGLALVILRRRRAA